MSFTCLYSAACWSQLGPKNTTLKGKNIKPHTSNKARYGLCHGKNSIELWVQNPLKPSSEVSGMSLFQDSLGHVVYGWPWMPLDISLILDVCE